MPDQLRLSLLGKLKIERNDQPLALTSVKGRALLVYLAVTRQAHSRSALAGLLWSDMPEADARTNLRVTLSQLRKVVGDVIIATRRTIELNAASDIWLDVAVLEQAAGRGNDLAVAAELYRGDFLDDFQVPEAELFEEWLRVERERLRQLTLDVLSQVADQSLIEGQLSTGIKAARRLLSLEPWHEAGHRQLMKLLAADGQRSAALAQYETCQRLLAEELGIEPSEETTELYEQIREGTWSRGAVEQRDQHETIDLPTFLSTTPPPPSTRAPFVARERELRQLDEVFAQVLEGQGRVAFITGEAGQGKTALMNKFARQMQHRHPKVIVASGNCNAYSGVGDPYLPFRDVMGMLTGEVEARWTAGVISQAHARQLWALLPNSVQAIVEQGPDLIDVFVSGAALKKRAEIALPPGSEAQHALQALATAKPARSTDLAQTQLFEQYTDILKTLAAHQPLLLLLDDLQWADSASISLLFHLGWRLAGSQIMILGAYRPSEVALGRSAATGTEPAATQHPLQPVVNEFIGHFGPIQIDLEQTSPAEGRGFVDALLDCEINDLPERFRAALFTQTQGHPLFTVELLRDLQEQGDLIKNEAGRWVAGARLDWSRLPTRVEAVIEQRISRLDEPLRDILTVASVEGEIFTAQVAAHIQSLEERWVLHQLSRELEQRHSLVREYEEISAGHRQLSRYRFGHALFQQYLYLKLSGGERRLLHGEVAHTLEAFYQDQPHEMIVQLAHHYLEAGDQDKSLAYLVRAGDQARRVAALDEAARYYQIACERWPADDEAGRAQTLRKLGECLWIAGHLQAALESLEEGFTLFEALGDWQNAGAMQRLMGQMYSEQEDREAAFQHLQQALAILERGPESVELAHALSAISRLHMMASAYPQAISWGERALALADRLDAEAVTIHALNNMAICHAGLGHWKRGLAMMRQSLNHAFSLNLPHDACRAYYNLSGILQGVGNYAEARVVAEELLAYATQVHVSHHLSTMLVQLAWLDWLTGQWGAALERRQEIVNWLESHQSLGHLKVTSTLLFGQIYNELGLAQAARQEMEDGLASARRASVLQVVMPHLGELLRAYQVLAMESEAAAIVAEINHWVDEAEYLDATNAVQLLFACQWLAQAKLASPNEINASLQRLERIDLQVGTPISAACLSEGRGYVALAEANAVEATEPFRQAIAGWNDLGRPYDRARALNGLGQALAQTGEMDEAKHVFDQAWGLIDSLAGQLDDPELRQSFLNSVLVRDIRRALVRLAN